MCGMIGCAGIIAGVAFILGLGGSLFATEATFFERLMMASMTAAMAFVAAMLLFSRDHLRHRRAVRQIREMLLSRGDVNDSDFTSHFPDVDPSLIVETRQAVANFFDVRAEKIHPLDDLRKDLRFDTLEPSFHSSVVFHICAVRKIVLRSFSFDTRALVTIGDLANEVQRVLNSFASDGEIETKSLRDR
jgi:hypothetical protein